MRPAKERLCHGLKVVNRISTRLHLWHVVFFYCKRLAFHLSAESQARYTDIACRVIKHVPLPCLKDHKFQLIEPRVSGSQVATEGWL